jgi:hypothetical protein
VVLTDPFESPVLENDKQSHPRAYNNVGHDSVNMCIKNK